MTKYCIEKTISYIDYLKLLPDILSPSNIWNESYDESDEEESISNYCTSYSGNICFVISNLWNKREKHIKTDYAVTGWMLCLIPHIREYLFKILQNNHHIQVNTVIKRLLSGSTKKELHETINTFWSKYKNCNHNNDPFLNNEFLWNSKYISDSNSRIWHQKYSLSSTKFLGFVACRVTLNILGKGSSERSWGDVKTIKSGNLSSIGSDIELE